MLKKRGGILAFGVVAALLFSLTLTHGPSSGDLWSAEVGAWQIATEGSPWIDDVTLDDLPETWDIGTLKESLLWITTNQDNGHQVIARSPGAILPAVPAYALNNLFQPRADGHRLPTWPGSVTAIILAWIGLMLLLGSLMRVVDRRSAYVGAAVLGFTTPYWTIVGNDLWPHCLGALGICGMAWALPRERWWSAGLFGGLALLGRLHLAIIVGVAGVLLALWRRDLRIALRIATTSVPFVGLCMLWSRWMYGSWSPTGGYQMGDLTGWAASRSALDRVTDYLGFLVSPGAGLLVWSPLLILLIPVAIRHWRAAPDWTRALALAALPYLLVSGWLNPFSGGTGFWGYRLPIESLCAWVPLLAFAATRLGRGWRAAAVTLIGIQLGFVLPGVLWGIGSTDSGGAGWDSSRWQQALAEQPIAILLVMVTGLMAAWFIALRLGRSSGIT